LVPERRNCDWNSRNEPNWVEELRNLEPQPLQLGNAGDGAKQVLGGNDAHRRLFFLVVVNLRLIT
jgi:hypothetical protein